MANAVVATPSSLPHHGRRDPDAGEASPAAAFGVVVTVTTDRNGDVTWCCDGTELLVGRTRQELVGRPFPLSVFDQQELRRRAESAGVAPDAGLFLLPPGRLDRRRRPGPDLGDLERRGRSTSAPGRLSAGCGAPQVSWSVIAADGSRRVLAITVQPQHDSAGRVLGYVAQGVDITQQQETNDLLTEALLREQEAARRLAALEEVRSNFVATASHELRTPLTSIVGYVQLLEERVGAASCRSLTDPIRRNAQRLQELADGLLAVSTSAAHWEPRLAPTDLRGLLSAVVEPFRTPADPGAVVPRCTMPSYPVTIMADPAWLSSAICKLVENAVAFTPSEGRIDCTVRVVGDEAVITVADTGPGLVLSELPHLFSPFFRGVATRDGEIPGSGLGLSLAAEVVKEHGGRVTVAENQPRGAAFSFHLPRITGPAA